MMADGQIVKPLVAIQQIALVPYPFRDGAVCDPGLVLALGEIAGRAARAVAELGAPRGR